MMNVDMGFVSVKQISPTRRAASGIQLEASAEKLTVERICRP